MARILILEELGSIDHLKRQMETLGHETTATESDAYIAFAAVDKARADLILLGMSMPGGGGVEMLLRLRHDPRTKGKPIIAMFDPTDWTEVIPLDPISRLLQKPTDLDTMKLLVDELLVLVPPAAPERTAAPELDEPAAGFGDADSEFPKPRALGEAKRPAAMDFGDSPDDEPPPGEILEL